MAIDWKSVDKRSPLAWTNLADQLIGKAQFQASRSPIDPDALAAAIADFAEFIEEANSLCPVEAIEAVRRAMTQLSQLSLLIANGKLDSEAAKLDAISARLSSASNELKVDAAWLRLEPVQRGIGILAGVVARVKAVEAAVDTLPKKDVAGRLSEILKELDTLSDELEDAVRS